MKLSYRDATEADLPFIDALIASDEIAAARDVLRPENDPEQLAGLRAITADPNQRLLIVEHEGKPVASFQIGFLPGISRRGTWRGQIESVRVRADLRGSGIGAEMMHWAVENCRERGCTIVQLTSDAGRKDAHRFYERLGFAPSHIGFKLKLNQAATHPYPA